jgi:ribosomal-protein-alanine N-acetyltransferase
MLAYGRKSEMAETREVGVRIEPVGDEHETRVQELASDPAVAATSNVPSPYPPDGARTWIAHAREKREDGLLYAFAVIDSTEGLVGVSSLMAVDRSKGTGDLGYWMGRPYWGRGYATAGARLVVAFGLGELGLTAIRATCLVENTASARVLGKLGFEAYGPGPADSRGPTMNFILRSTGVR